MGGHRALRLCGCMLALLSWPVLAVGLLEAYQAARQNDPNFRAARYEREAGQQAIAIGRAGLLPNLSVASSYSQNKGQRDSTIVNVTQQLDYNDSVSALVLRQPLFNYDSLVRYRQGSVQAAQSDAVFDRKEAELALKVAGGYLDALLAKDRLALADAEIAAYGAQRELAERRRKAGEGTITDVADAESRLQLARAGRADALDRVAVATHKLERMAGRPMQPLWPLRPDFLPTGVRPDRLEEWAVLAQDNNPELRARRKAYELASLEVDRNRAGHLPQLDLVARSQQARNETLSTLNQQSSINTVGVELNLPLLAGGRVMALTDQAIANRERALAEVEAVANDIQVEIQRLFLAVETGASKVSAYQKAADAGAVAVEGSKRGLMAGIRTTTDVLDAERLMFSAQRDLFQARYEVLASALQLKAMAGKLSETDVAEVASLLVPQD